MERVKVVGIILVRVDMFSTIRFLARTNSGLKDTPEPGRAGGTLQVLDHEPQAWFLFEEDGALFLDANCNQGALGYSFMIQLSPGELTEYRSKGRPYLSWLAQDIQDSAPILQVSKSIYKGRDVSAAYAKKVSQAVASWRATRAP